MAPGLDQTTESTGVVEYAAATSAPPLGRLLSCTKLLEFQPSPRRPGARASALEPDPIRTDRPCIVWFRYPPLLILVPLGTPASEAAPVFQARQSPGWAGGAVAPVAAFATGPISRRLLSGVWSHRAGNSRAPGFGGTPWKLGLLLPPAVSPGCRTGLVHPDGEVEHRSRHFGDVWLTPDCVGVSPSRLRTFRASGAAYCSPRFS